MNNAEHQDFPESSGVLRNRSSSVNFSAGAWEARFWRIFPAIPVLIAILLVGLFEWYHRDLTDSELEEARQLLVPAATKLLDGFDPRRMLADTLRENLTLDKAGIHELAGKFIDPRKTLLKPDQPAIMFGLFDEDGKLVRQSNPGGTQTNWEGLWKRKCLAC